MSKIIVCYKWVLDEADIRIKADLSIDASKAKSMISSYDLNAIETGMRSASEGDEVVSLTYGMASAQASLKDALSRGPAQAYWVNDESAGQADGAVTAKVLAAAIRTIDDVKLVICGEGAADTYAHEVAPRLGALLGMPAITNVTSLRVEGSTLTVTRKTEDLVETMHTAVPAVVSVLPEICPAPIPGLKMVLAASKKPVTELHVQDLGLTPEDLRPRTRVKQVQGYVNKRKNIIFNEGQRAEQVQQLIRALRQEGVLA